MFLYEGVEYCEELVVWIVDGVGVGVVCGDVVVVVE